MPIPAAEVPTFSSIADIVLAMPARLRDADLLLALWRAETLGREKMQFEIREHRDQVAGARDAARAILRLFIELRDRPHGFSDLPWYEPAFDAARAHLALVDL